MKRHLVRIYHHSLHQKKALVIASAFFFFRRVAATGTSQIVGMAIVATTDENAVLTDRNPTESAAALTITPLAGGTRPVSAHLVITQIG